MHDALFANHLAFLGTHRGRVSHEKGATLLDGDRAAFTYAVLGRDADLKALLPRYARVQVTPWSAPGLRDALSEAGYAWLETVCYQVLRGPLSSTGASLTIRRAETEAEFEDFSRVQAGGFAPGPEHVDDLCAWLSRANRQNLGNPLQHFYVGYLEGRPAGTVLAVDTEGVTGIYAVATLPQERQRGVSTTLLRHAVEQAAGRTITLQVLHGSYAESLYLKLGFETVFQVEAWER